MPIALVAPLWIVLAAAAPASPGPTLAREDTMYTEVPEILVTAPRVTLDEILDRVARGEARRDSMLTDQAFTATLRIVRVARGNKEAELIEETVARVHKKRPDRVRSVLLRHWKKKGDRGGLQVNFRPDMSEQIVNFAFRPEARRDYRYRILGRDLVENRVIYRLGFEPRSRLDPSDPSGEVWVDTNEFVIVRQEVMFDRSPVPLFLKDVSRIVIERRREQGFWVLWRMLARVETQLPLPAFGRAFDISIQLDRYAINAGIDDAFFERRGGRR